MTKDTDFEVVISPEVLAQLEANPELAKAYLAVSERIMQAVAGFNAGKFKTMDEAMRSIGAEPHDPDDD